MHLYQQHRTLQRRGKTMLDDLAGISDVSDSEDSSDEGEQKEEQQPVGKKAKKEITLEDLQKAGYQAKSILHMRAPTETVQCDFRW